MAEEEEKKAEEQAEGEAPEGVAAESAADDEQAAGSDEHAAAEAEAPAEAEAEAEDHAALTIVESARQARVLAAVAVIALGRGNARGSGDESKGEKRLGSRLHELSPMVASAVGRIFASPRPAIKVATAFEVAMLRGRTSA